MAPIPVVGLSTFLPWGPFAIAGLGAMAGCLYTRLSVGRRRVRDARFDTGPNGLATYYEWLRDALFTFLKWAVYLGLAELVAYQAARWVHLKHSFSEQITLVTFWALVAIGLYTGFCAGRAAMNGGLWLALEFKGMRYEVRDGRNYRIRFIHRSGAATVDDTPWEARIQAEQEGLSINDGQFHDQLRALVMQLLRVGIWYAVIAYGSDWAAHVRMEGFFGDVLHSLGSLAIYYRLNIIVPAIVAAQRVAVPLASLLIVIMDRLAYALGAQFASLVHVKDDADARIDLKDVMGQQATGNAGFATKTGRRKSMGT